MRFAAPKASRVQLAPWPIMVHSGVWGIQGFQGLGSWAAAHLRFHVSEQAEDDCVDAQYLHGVWSGLTDAQYLVPRALMLSTSSVDAQYLSTSTPSTGHRVRATSIQTRTLAHTLGTHLNQTTTETQTDGQGGRGENRGGTWADSLACGRVEYPGMPLSPGSPSPLAPQHTLPQASLPCPSSSSPPPRASAGVQSNAE